jgi:hypothetical protein
MLFCLVAIAFISGFVMATMFQHALRIQSHLVQDYSFLPPPLLNKTEPLLLLDKTEQPSPTPKKIAKELARERAI